MKLDPHQEVAVQWLLDHPRGGLADEMRVGKTAPTVVAAAQAGADRILVLCPAHVRGVWDAAIQDWYGGEGRAEGETRSGATGEWQVWSYDQFASQANARRDRIIAWRPDTLILDECHYLKNARAKRTQCIYGTQAAGSELLDHARRVWLLSGTPCPNGPHELWTHFHAVLSDPLSYYDWLRRYCEFSHTEFGIKVHGVRKIALPDLRAKFRARFLRRTFRAVHGNDEDPLVWNVVPLRPGKIPREAFTVTRTKAHKALVARLQREDATALAESEAPLATLRRLTADLKADLTVQHVREYLEDPAKKVLVLGYHREVLTAVAKALDGVLLLGGTSDAGKARKMAAFQQGSARVFVGQVTACGSGIDLSAADAVVFAETVWTPGDNVQAAMRSQHRDKQHPVPVDVLVLAGSIDEAVERVKLRKYRMIRATYDEEE